MTLVPYWISVQLFGLGINSVFDTPASLEVIQAEFAMDVAIITYWGGDATANSVQSGMPLKVTWGAPSSTRIFYGYVNHVDRSNQQTTGQSAVSRNSTTIIAVGASWPMKNVSSSSNSNTTTAPIIQQLAANYGLAADVVPDSTVWTNLAQAGLSDWAFCVKLAQMIGYTFYANGTTLVYKPRTTNPNAITSLAAAYDLRANPGAMTLFNPQLGANSPAGGSLVNRRMGGINPRTVMPVFAQLSGSNTPTTLGASQDAPVFDQVDIGAVHSQGEVNARVSGAAATNQLYITATATAGGNPLLAQGALIYVANGNGAQNGLWFITKAHHKITTKKYEVDLKLGRDSAGATASISELPLTALPAQSRLVGTTWLAA